MHHESQSQSCSADRPKFEENSFPDTRCLLLVDDNQEDLELVVRILQAQEFARPVVAANGGREALDYLYRRGRFSSRQQENPMFVLLDLKMPLVDGFDVLQQIKSDPGLKAIPVVMFTSSNQSGDVVRCYELGANAYVVKPVEFKDLVTKLKAIEGFWFTANEPSPEVKGRQRL